MKIEIDKDQINEDIVNWRRALHKIPELGIHLPKTQQFVISVLESLGVAYELSDIEVNGETETSIIGYIKGASEGKCIALRADMDALPITEETGLNFSSNHEGCMHACGHDAHTAMLLGAAKILQEYRKHLKGTVKLLFQTSEEDNSGSKLMIDRGALENPKVDAIFGIHVWPMEEYSAGTVFTKKGSIMASGDQFNINVYGKGAHGYQPDKSVDPIYIMSHIIQGLQAVRSREFSPEETMVLSVCQIHSGNTWNVIPSKGKMEGTIRAMMPENREFIMNRVESIAKGIASTYGAKSEVRWSNGTPPVVNDNDITELVFNAGKKHFKRDGIRELHRPVMASEDVSRYMELIPGCYSFLNVANKEEGLNDSLHSSHFNLDESVLWRGSLLHAQVALDFLNHSREDSLK